MASPTDPLSQHQQPQTQPLTPPAEPANPNTQSQTQIQTQASNPTSTTAAAAATTTSTQQPASNSAALASHPATSLSDSGATKRPRDARLIHLILSSLGVSAYQERVPLQLLDFAYRYTSSVLGDAAHIQAEGWDGSADAGGGAAGKAGRGKIGAAAGGAGAAGGGGGGGAGEKEEVSLASLRMAIGSRMQYQYQGSLPKEFLMGLAKERNRVGLGVGRGLAGAQQQGQQDASSLAGQMIGGVKLPPEKYCLTGIGWGLREEWDSEGEDMSLQQQQQQQQQGEGRLDADESMRMTGDEGDEDAEPTMEDIFGDDDGGGGGGGGDGRAGEDEEMQDG